MEADIWTFRSGTDLGADVTRGVDVTGCGVEALDGSIGKIDEATYDVGKSYIVVDTGPWIFGKKVAARRGDRPNRSRERKGLRPLYEGRVKAVPSSTSTYRDTNYRDEVGCTTARMAPAGATGACCPSPEVVNPRTRAAGAIV